jgi:Mce-associated membrane protein
MTEDKAPAPDAPKPPSRRRASRAAGPAGDAADTASTTTARVEAPGTVRVRSARPAGPPPRRPANRRLVGVISLVVGAISAAALAALITVLLVQQRNAEANQARDQRFVDTASQTVQNMFSYTQDNIDESVTRFVDGTSGPLRDMLSQNNNVENLKALFRDTNASSEAVINGAALENVDNLANRASVLVSVRVTVTDIEGINKPSQPYRLRLTVNEDDNGHMTAYDLQYPEGGN